MNINVALENIRKLQPKGHNPSLSPKARLEPLLKLLGNPDLHLPPIIHISGTNGKGSTLAFLQAMLEANGKKVHKFTSPHLINYNERIQICGQDIDNNQLLQSINAVENIINGKSIRFFDAITLIAIHAFAQVSADFLLLETGMGGEFDATNIFDKPLITAISSIALDHTEVLGSTIAEITKTKCGIIKQNIPFIVGCQNNLEIYNIALNEAEKHSSPTSFYDKDWSIKKSNNSIIYKSNNNNWTLPMPSLIGEHQIKNAGLAIAIAEQLNIPQNHIATGLENTSWNGRMQRIITSSNGETIWLDGAHNPDAALALLKEIQNWQSSNIHTDIITCISKKRNPISFLEPLLNIANSITAIPLNNYNGILYGTEQDIQNYIDSEPKLINLHTSPSWQQAIKNLRSKSKTNRILITGSLYLAGDVLKYYKDEKKEL